LEFIDKLGLFSTIFSNHRDQTEADTSSWSLAYNALHRLLSPSASDTDDLLATDRVRNMLVRDCSDAYSAWMVVALSPWANVPAPQKLTQEKKPPPPYMAKVARDSLRSDNKTMSILADAALRFHMIADVKTSFLTGKISDSDAEIRQQVGCNIRSWKKDWRPCVIMSIAHEVMSGAEFSTGKAFSPSAFPMIANIAFSIVIHEYDRFLSYVKEQDLLDVWALQPIVKGNEVIKAMGAEKGSWIIKALDMVVQWQLLHPNNFEKEAALEEIKRRKAELEYEPRGKK
jgi:tRNA nucleotidyltransferase (CCA-adding enzyme)